MKHPEQTDSAPTQSLSFDVDLPHPPETVWRALTEPDLLAEWLLPAVDLGLEPGARFTFVADPQPGWDGVVHCRLLDVDPLRRLRYAWVVGDIDTVVTFTLAPTAEGTRLTIVQSGFQPDQKKNLGGARYGWTRMSEKLVALLAKTD